MCEPTTTIPTDPIVARAELWEEIFELDDVLGRVLCAASAAAALADRSRSGRRDPDVVEIGADWAAWEALGLIKDIRARYATIFELAKAAKLKEGGHEHG